MLEKLTASQLAEWYAFNRLYPIGEERADFRDSFMASMITNLVIRINGKKGAKLTSVKDFIFNWDMDSSTGTKTQSVDDMKTMFQQIAASNQLSDTEKKIKEQRRTRKPISYTKKK